MENDFNREKLINRMEALALEWVTFEDLLGLSDLVRDQIPGKYQISPKTWEEVLKEIGREDILGECQSKG